MPVGCMPEKTMGVTSSSCVSCSPFSWKAGCEYEHRGERNWLPASRRRVRVAALTNDDGLPRRTQADTANICSWLFFMSRRPETGTVDGEISSCSVHCSSLGDADQIRLYRGIVSLLFNHVVR